MLVDANLLLCSTDATSRFFAPAREWLLAQLNGPRHIGLPWQNLAAFLPRWAGQNPLAPA